MPTDPRQRAAVLCPGPSLSRALPRIGRGQEGQFGRTFGVNRAAGAMACDFWSASDTDTFFDTTPVGRPTLIMGKNCWTATKKRASRLGCPADDWPVILRQGLVGPAGVRWHSFSATIAVVAAWTFGAREIVVFGCDLKGTSDWDGTELAHQRRDAKRWSKEATIWTQVQEWLERQGTRLVRR